MKIDSYDVQTGSSHGYQRVDYGRISLWAGRGIQSGFNDYEASTSRTDSLFFTGTATRQNNNPIYDSNGRLNGNGHGQKNENLNAHNNGNGQKNGHVGVTDNGDGTITVNVRASAETSVTVATSSTARTGFEGGLNFTDTQRLKMEMLSQLLFSFTGRRLNLSFLDLPRMRDAGQNGSKPLDLFATGNRPAGNASGVQLVAERYGAEQETVEYGAKGVVKTEDGRTINVDLLMRMSRESAEYSRTSLGLDFPQGNASAVDPLVFNYGGNATRLTDEKFEFDLDFDGNMEEISFAGPGSGFLALDKNDDGTINDGRELFGPNTGNGFDELRSHDADGNGWIDENDSVFSKLRIWSKDSEGNDQLFTLAELGIGAVYLGDTATEFTMQDNAGDTQGNMRSTSFFLNEDGGAGFVHHIDLMA